MWNIEGYLYLKLWECFFEKHLDIVSRVSILLGGNSGGGYGGGSSSYGGNSGSGGFSSSSSGGAGNMVTQEDTIFVAGMDPSITEDDIQDHFGSIGVIKVSHYTVQLNLDHPIFFFHR